MSHIRSHIVEYNSNIRPGLQVEVTYTNVRLADTINGTSVDVRIRINPKDHAFFNVFEDNDKYYSYLEFCPPINEPTNVDDNRVYNVKSSLRNHNLPHDHIECD